MSTFEKSHLEWIFFGGVVASIVAISMWLKHRESFTIHEKEGSTCIPSTSSLPPNSDAMNVPLQPNTIRLAIQGYNYQEDPVFFRDGKKIVPISYARNSNDLTYFFTLACPKGVCNHEWILETYDFVKPIVVNQDQNEQMTVIPVRRRLGYNRWQIKC